MYRKFIAKQWPFKEYIILETGNGEGVILARLVDDRLDLVRQGDYDTLLSELGNYDEVIK